MNELHWGLILIFFGVLGLAGLFGIIDLLRKPNPLQPKPPEIPQGSTDD